MAVTQTSNVGGLLQGTGSGATLSPVGVQAKSPTSTVTPPSNTLPSSQVAAPKVNDLSGSYANVNGTIYNKGTGQAYSTPEQFYSASGVNSFNNLKFDTSWTPPTVSGGLLQSPGSTLSPTSNAPTAPVTSGPQTTSATTSNPVGTGTTAYTPPNQGTTGVSQGGIIGNLIGAGNGQTSQAVTDATNKLAADQKAQQNRLTAASEDSGDMSLALGREGQITQNTGGILTADQQAVQNALTAQGQQIGATTSAGQLNAPITGVQPGTITIQPSQTNGATTSGAASLNSLIGQRPSTTSPGVTEFYNTQTGQGFSTPAALSAFVNQQNPNANTTPDSVFQYIQANGNANTGNGTIAGGNSSLNPVANIPSIAQQVVNGTLSYQDALSQGGSVANFSGALNQAITQLQPGFNFNTAQGSSAAQQTTSQQQQQTQAAYQSAEQQASNLGSQLNNLISTFGLNPTNITAVNAGIQTIAKNTSSPQYQALSNYLADLAGVWSPVFSAAGDSTDATRFTAANMINSLASGSSIQSVLATLQAAAQAKIAGVQTQPITNSQGSGVGDNGSSLYNF